MTTQTKTNWRKVKLGEVADVLNGYAFSSRAFIPKSGRAIPVFKMGNIKEGGGIQWTGKEDYIPENQAQGLVRFLTEPEDILMCMTDMKANVRLLGYSAFIKNEKFLVNQRVGRIKAKKNLAQARFLFYYLNSPNYISFIRSTARSGVQVNLTTEEIRKSPLLIPEITDQKHIADILSAFDDKIELNNKISRTLEQMAQAIFKEWFVNFKFPGHEKIKMVDSELGKIPEGWEVKSWGNLEGECLAGDWGEDVASTEAPRRSYILRGTDIPALQSGGKGECPARYLSDNSLKRRQLKPGDIVIEISGGSKGQPTGRSIFITQEILNRFNMPLVCTSFCRLVRGNGILAPVLMYLHLDRLYKTKKIWNYQLQSTGISNFQYGQFRDYEFLIVPPRVIQEKIITIFFSYIEYGHRNEKQKLATLRDLLLPKLVSGEIKV